MAQNIDSSYIIYQKQFESLSQMRGIPQNEIVDILAEYKTNEIHSNQDFAKLLGQFYSAKKNIGILLYFFNNDTLKRIFFEPGIIKEEISIPITEKELSGLCVNLNQALNLYKLSANRSPKLRGLRVQGNPPMKYDLKDVTAKLTNILLPESFNENYKHLIIIPCLNIGSLPFHLLKPYKDDFYLVERCSFTMAPNLIDFIFLRAKLLENFHGARL